MLLKNLSAKLKSFTLGDLVTMSEIQELFETLLESDELSDGENEICKNLFTEFKGLMKGRDSDEKKSILSGIKKGINKIYKKHSKKEEIIETPEKDQAPEMDMDVLISFISESRDHLETIEEKIMDLETGFNPEVVDEIFRSMHTIKGVASFLGLSRIKTLSHLLESILDKLRQNEIPVNSHTIDILLTGGDILTKLVLDLDDKVNRKTKKHENIEIAELELDISDFTHQFEKVLRSDSKNEKSQKPKDELVTKEMIQKFVSESFDMLDEVEQNILDMEKTSQLSKLIGNAFRLIHTVKGNAGFFWFGKVEYICMNLENMLELLRKKDSVLTIDTISSLLNAIDYLRKSLHEIDNDEIEPGEYDGENIDIFGGPEPGSQLGDILISMGEAKKDDIQEALKVQSMKLGEILVEKGTVSENAVKHALLRQGKIASAEIEKQYTTKKKDIRINTERLDHMFNLMGELITAGAMVIHNPDIIGMDLPNFTKSANYLSKITREMQEVTMSMRMVPLDGLFSKMRRLVRDLSRKFNKDVRINISGEETEMDRNVMEEISDPLIHIIRNSIDHGIEDTNSRIKNKKNNFGTINLSARYEGNEVWIVIKDDGKGLDKEKILLKAIEKNLITKDQELNDKEIYQLIFAPGFSTAEKVSEISGRGVGMDVVKKNIDKLRGKVDIDSEKDKYTEIILKIPLTLAIVDAVTTRVGSMLYSIPINDITSFQKPQKSKLTMTDHNKTVYNHRKMLIPVIDLSQFFNVPKEKESLDEGIFIVVNSAEKTVAVCADEIVGYRQVVIKPLPSYIGSMKAISGCSVQEDGDVSMILDVNALCAQTIG